MQESKKEVNWVEENFELLKGRELGITGDSPISIR